MQRHILYWLPLTFSCAYSLITAPPPHPEFHAACAPLCQVPVDKNTLTAYAIIITLFLILLAVLLIRVIRELRMLRCDRQSLQAACLQQQELNNRLLEANRIREAFIGSYLAGHAEWHTRITHFAQQVEKKAVARKPEDILLLVNNLELKQEKEALLQKFDQTFLRLFPHFVEAFNALFAEEDKITLREQGQLNTDLRIFALIRLGINENEKIARVLGYSPNTIHAYKTRVRNRALIANEVFDKRVMGIEGM